MPPRRRKLGIYNKAALAPLRVRRRDPVARVLPVTEHRMYALRQRAKIRWYPRTGWRMDGQLCNAVVHEMIQARWLKVVVEDGKRTLKLDEVGEQLMGGGG